MKVLALDLSLTSTGVALPACDVERWVPSTGLRGMERLDWFRSVLAQALAADMPDLVVLEGYSMGTARQASHAHALGELGGVLRHTLWRNQQPFVDVPPASLKKYATGKGNAKKELMLVEAVKRLGYDGSSNDEADALWLRAMALDAYGEPVVQMPQVNREATGAVVWPQLGAKACSG
jgi:Holliday junction resolvasome RuvABC endonuclease subunit